MTDEKPDDLPELPPFADFLQSLPPEMIEKLIAGRAMIGEPDEGMKLLQLAAKSTETDQPFHDLVMGTTDPTELHQIMAHLQGLLVNLHQMIAIVMSKQIKNLLDEDDDLYAQDQEDWGPGA